MTERTLLLKSSFLYPYYIVGTDYPSARVFHAASSNPIQQQQQQHNNNDDDHNLTCVVELPPKYRSSLTTVRMTAVALGGVPSSSSKNNKNNNNKNNNSGAATDADVGALRMYYAAMGLSNGSVLFYNITLDRAEEFVSVSETQKPILSIQCVQAGNGEGFVFVLSENNVVYVLDLKELHRGVLASFKVQTGASALAVATAAAAEADTDNNDDNNNNVFRVLVAGPTSVLYHVEVSNNNNNSNSNNGQQQKSVAASLISNKLISFASQGNTVDHAWLSSCHTQNEANKKGETTWQCAVTACAQEGLIRVWDLFTSEVSVMAADSETNNNNNKNENDAKGLALSEKARIQHYFNPNANQQHAAMVNTAQQQQQVRAARCVRTLQCGQRMSTLSALLYLNPLAASPDAKQKLSYQLFLSASTFTGYTFCWRTEASVAGRNKNNNNNSGAGGNADAVLPLAPHYVLYTQDAKAKLVYATLFSIPSVATSESGDNHNNKSKKKGKRVSFEKDIRIGLVRGKFAFPHFETVTIASLQHDHQSKLKKPNTSSNNNNNNSKGEQKALQNAKAIAASLGFRTASNMEVVEVPASLSAAAAAANKARAIFEQNAAANGTDAAQNAFQLVDEHILFIQEKYKKAQKAAMSNSESFSYIVPVQAKSIKDLPLQKMTLEERLRYLTNAAAAAAELAEQKNNKEGEEEEAVEAAKKQNEAAAVVTKRPLGLSTVPLYQALHVQDSSAVMELLAISARSEIDRKQTVLHLHIRYVLQLLLVLSQRLGVCNTGTASAAVLKAKETNKAAHTSSSTTSALVVGGGLAAVSARSPILEWFHAILHYRGMELYALQKEMNAKKREKQQQQKQQQQQQQKRRGSDAKSASSQQATQDEATREDEETQAAAENEDEMLTSSSPKEFIAPIYHQYKQMTNLYDKLALLHGRLTIFNSIRPQEKYNFYNRERHMLSSNMEMEATKMNDFQAQSRMERLSRQSKKQKSAARPQTLLNKTNFGGTRDDILFPVMFTEVKTHKGGARVVRVRSRLETERRRYAREHANKAMHAAIKQRIALREKKRSSGAGEDDEDPDAILNLGGGDMDLGDDMDLDDLDAMEAMAAMDGGSGEEDDDGEKDNEDVMIAEDELGGRPRRRRQGGQQAADDDDEDASEDDMNDGSSSSDDAEFSSSSDDALSEDYDHQKDLDGVLGLEDEDEENSDDDDDDEEDEDEADDNPYHQSTQKHSSDDENAEDNDSEDGEVHDENGHRRPHAFHEYMREALEGDEGETEMERKKHKRIRTD